LRGRSKSLSITPTKDRALELKRRRSINVLKTVTDPFVIPSSTIFLDFLDDSHSVTHFFASLDAFSEETDDETGVRQHLT